MGELIKPCDECHGNGRVEMLEHCPCCHGSGQVVDLELAHKLCRNNRDAITFSRNCGCFYCSAVFPASEVSTYWGNDAVCPRCGIDAVIPDASGIILQKKFLGDMHARWFDI